MWLKKVLSFDFVPGTVIPDGRHSLNTVFGHGFQPRSRTASGDSQSTHAELKELFELYRIKQVKRFLALTEGIALTFLSMSSLIVSDRVEESDTMGAMEIHVAISLVESGLSLLFPSHCTENLLMNCSSCCFPNFEKLSRQYQSQTALLTHIKERLHSHVFSEEDARKYMRRLSQLFVPCFVVLIITWGLEQFLKHFASESVNDVFDDIERGFSFLVPSFQLAFCLLFPVYLECRTRDEERQPLNDSSSRVSTTNYGALGDGDVQMTQHSRTIAGALPASTLSTQVQVTSLPTNTSTVSSDALMVSVRSAQDPSDSLRTGLLTASTEVVSAPSTQDQIVSSTTNLLPASFGVSSVSVVAAVAPQPPTSV